MIEVITKMIAKKERVDDLISEFKKMVDASTNEQGCLFYKMYQDEIDPTIIMVIEEWERRADFDAHCESVHFEQSVPKMLLCLQEDPEMNICVLVAG